MEALAKTMEFILKQLKEERRMRRLLEERMETLEVKLSDTTKRVTLLEGRAREADALETRLISTEREVQTPKADKGARCLNVILVL